MPVTMQIIDLTPKFLKFYEAAQGAAPEKRWNLWQEHYGFAAIPPTEEGMRTARKLLDESWHRYPEAMEQIRAGAGGYEPHPQASMEAVCRLLAFEGDLALRFVVFVGNFDQNAFALTHEGVAMVHFPVESDQEFRELTTPHEFAHVVHDRLCGHPGGYLRSAALLFMQEGIAIATAQALVPGRRPEAYIESVPGWLAACQARDKEVLAGVRPYLSEVSEEDLWRFTIGTGPSGLIREGYYVGWRVVGHLLQQGYTLAALARVAEADLPPLLDRALAELTG